ncbi:4Fe-4S binding protein [Candidatus Formimonas warabiya]|uniref:4Fe-4S ferredoxin n=1 Tax=Formimonas warabiya TaxID=1761012 RepID=A0A3G1KVD0_FORW1|nr:4Fe-4S binding protein [Candidatus Formimonas warabiya]ATW26165.1 4Fe-4S ferredoxin [Candidatus Formimonas warabiya]
MLKEDIIQIAGHFFNNSDDNIISEQVALSKNVVGMKIFKTPLIAFGAADDKLFNSLKDPSIIGHHYLTPLEWLPNAKTVISIFIPFSDEIIKSNMKDKIWPSEGWLHGRVEGQALIFKLCEHLNSELINAGYESLVPSRDKRFWSFTNSNLAATEDDPIGETSLKFTSNWSERHAGFICGQGTFGLSKGLITKNGIAGRMGSIITNLSLPPDKREYEEIYQYCSMCGKCAENCPVNAISLEKGKDHLICAKFLNKTKERLPRYGCGKCQAGVPCASGIPGN